MEKEKLNEIYNNLQKGKVYGEYIQNRLTNKRDLFWSTLYIVLGNNGQKYICWRNYGSSCNKNTKKDLQWVLTNIFQMKPSEFLCKYVIEE